MTCTSDLAFFGTANCFRRSYRHPSLSGGPRIRTPSTALHSTAKLVYASRRCAVANVPARIGTLRRSDGALEETVTIVSDRWLLLAALNGFLAVAAGAFGAHALKSRLDPQSLNTFEVAARYQMYHALALLAVAWLATARPSTNVSLAGWCFTLGILIFSGSLYALALGGWRWMGAITPIGGLLFLAGWSLLALAAMMPAK